MASEQEDLDQFVQSAGWLRFCRHAEEEWNDRFQQHVRTAINDADDVAALRKLQQVTVAKDAVERLLKWPKERLQQLDLMTGSFVDPMEQPLSRRGRL
jgi:hypothetical protein